MSIKSEITKDTLKQIEKITKSKLSLGKVLGAIRKADEMTQVDFAEKLNITKQHLCDIEHDRKSISPKLAASYAIILGYSKEQFIQLALQDMVDRDNLGVAIEVVHKRKKAA